MMSYTYLQECKLISYIVPSNTELKSFTNHKIKVHGSIRLPIEIGGLKTVTEFLVTDFHFEGYNFLLGMDYLSINDIKLSLKARILQTPKGQANFNDVPKQLPNRCNLILKSEVNLIPNTMSVIECTLKSKNRVKLYGDYYGINRSSSAMIQDGIFIENSLSRSSGKSVFVKLVYVGDEEKTIPKNKILGHFTKCVIPDIINQISASPSNEFSEKCHENINEHGEGDEGDLEKLFEKLEIDTLKISESEKAKLKGIIAKHQKAFSTHKYDIGLCNFYKARIDLKRDFKPVWAKSHPISYKMQDEMDEKIANLLKEGAIEPCTASLWNSPVFLVKKSGGGTRLVADMRSVNKECLLDNYDLPNITRLLDEIGPAKYFTTMDITSSYNQIEYEPESRPLTAFLYKNQQYMYKRLVQGQKSSPAKFCRMTARLFAKLPFRNFIHFVDDLMIPTHDVSSHLQYLDHILERIENAGLKINPQKSKLLRSEVKFVGHMISKDGVTMDKDRLKPILELKPPRNIRETQSLLGVLNYNRNYVENFASIARPLYELLSKSKKFNWTNECQAAMDKIKTALTNPPVMAFPDLENDDNIFEVVTDSSQEGYGAVLYQHIGNEKKIISYFSKATPRLIKTMHATKLEFLGLYYAVKNWKFLLQGRFFRIMTDCMPIIDLDKLYLDGSNIVKRKILELSSFNMEIAHISGKANVFSDFLSRYPFNNKGVDKSMQTDPILPPAMPTLEPVKVVKMITANSEISEIESAQHDLEINEHQIAQHNLMLPLSKSGLELVNIVNLTTTNSHSEISENEVVQNGSSTHIEYDNTYQEKVHALFTETELAKSQENDPVTSEVIKWVTKGSRPEHIQEHMQSPELLSFFRQFNSLKFENGLLYRKWTSVTNENGIKWLKVVPLDLQLGIMSYYHESITTCHPGLEICLDRCRTLFYWPKMEQDFKLYVGSCVKCNQNKQARHYLRAPLKPLVVGCFNAAIGIDHIIMNNGRKTAREHTCILSITDFYTNYTVLVSCKGQTSEESIGHLLKHWFLPFGLPLALYHDLHPGFTSKLFSKILEVFQIKNTRNTRYRCKNNGRAEAINKRAGAALRAAIPQNDINNWDQYVMFVNAALNSLKSRHTGFTPNFLVFGREIMYPIEWFMNLNTDCIIYDPTLSLPPNDKDASNYTPQAMYANKLYNNMKAVNRKVHQTIKRQAGYMKRAYDKHLKGPYFNAGDYVMRLIEPPQTKLKPRWSGPHYVKEKISDHLYLIKLGEDDFKIVNIEKLKPYKASKFSPMINAPVPKTNINNNVEGKKHTTTVSKGKAFLDLESDQEYNIIQEREGELKAPKLVISKSNDLQEEIPHVTNSVPLNSNPAQISRTNSEAESTDLMWDNSGLTRYSEHESDIDLYPDRIIDVEIERETINDQNLNKIITEPEIKISREPQSHHDSHSDSESETMFGNLFENIPTVENSEESSSNVMKRIIIGNDLIIDTSGSEHDNNKQQENIHEYCPSTPNNVIRTNNFSAIDPRPQSTRPRKLPLLRSMSRDPEYKPSASESRRLPTPVRTRPHRNCRKINYCELSDESEIDNDN